MRYYGILNLNVLSCMLQAVAQRRAVFREDSESKSVHRTGKRTVWVGTERRPSGY